MYWNMIKNDIRKTRLVTTALLLIITAAATLTSLALLVAGQLFQSVDDFMELAKTPHFLQMHSGSMDKERMDAFIRDNGLIEQSQILEFLNIDGSDMAVAGESLADSVTDNGLVVQSRCFDYLLGMEGEIIHVNPGEIYLPVSYLKENRARKGDMVRICQKQLKVAGFLRDSQMNSSLASSKRFLIHEKDYGELKKYGEMEYLIEFRLKDLSELSRFENQYAAMGLESNGPVITYPLFRMINTISDGLMIAVLLLVGLLLLAIAFLCIRFTILAKLEDDCHEIGIMKAIGLEEREIRGMYLLKYAVVSALGCLFGFLLALPLKHVVMEPVRLVMGGSSGQSFSLFTAVGGSFLLFLLVTGYVGRVLGRIKKISAARALRLYGLEETYGKAAGFGISASGLLGADIFLGIKDVCSRMKLYRTIWVIFILAFFILLVPLNLYTTITSKDFISYMGVGNCDIRIDVRQADNLVKRVGMIADTLNQDGRISKMNVLFTKSAQVLMEDGTSERMMVELGSHSVYPVYYVNGREPVSEGDIAISYVNARELNKQVGDTMVLNVDNEIKRLTVCGIYSDITNGGKTAKAAFAGNNDHIMWGTISVKVKDAKQAGEVVHAYTKQFPDAKVSDIEVYLSQTFGSTEASVKKAAYAAIAASVLISVVITALFMKMLISKDKYSISVLKAVGFTNEDIRIQYVSRFLFILVPGMILGTVLANTIGEWLAALLIASLGAASFRFHINPVAAYLFCPLLLTTAVFFTSVFSTIHAGKIKISDFIRE